MIFNPGMPATGGTTMYAGTLAGVGTKKTASITFETLPRLVILNFKDSSDRFGAINVDILHNPNGGTVKFYPISGVVTFTFNVSGTSISWTTESGGPGVTDTYYFAFT